MDNSKRKLRSTNAELDKKIKERQKRVEEKEKLIAERKESLV